MRGLKTLKDFQNKRKNITLTIKNRNNEIYERLDLVGLNLGCKTLFSMVEGCGDAKNTIQGICSALKLEVSCSHKNAMEQAAEIILWHSLITDATILDEPME